jgi:hypothetical protein
MDLKKKEEYISFNWRDMGVTTFNENNIPNHRPMWENCKIVNDKLFLRQRFSMYGGGLSVPYDTAEYVYVIEASNRTEIKRVPIDNVIRILSEEYETAFVTGWTVTADEEIVYSVREILNKDTDYHGATHLVFFDIEGNLLFSLPLPELPNDLGEIRQFYPGQIHSVGNDIFVFGMLSGTHSGILKISNTTSIADAENQTFREMGIRNIYPNPATSKITANIMCYVSTVSDVDMALYEFMGQKVLDLSNHFEYEPSTATIHISFDIPKSLSKGSYFLVVRSGKETRTQGIIVK